MDKKKNLTPIESSVEKMLSLARKEGCKESKNRIFRTIGFIKDDMVLFDDEGHALSTDFIRGRALANLESNYTKNRSKDIVSRDFLKKITALRDSLKKSIELMEDPAVIKILEHNANEHAKEKKLLQRYQQMLNVSSNIEYNAPKNHPETYHRMSELYEEMSWAVLSNSHKRNKGRASLTPLYDYAYELAVLYEKLSGEKLSVFRHKGAEGYEPITPGHNFIYTAIQLLNREFLKDNSEPLEEKYIEIYTSENIYNACEKAQKRLNHNQQ
jgi:hypothetical protein